MVPYLLCGSGSSPLNNKQIRLRIQALTWHKNKKIPQKMFLHISYFFWLCKYIYKNININWKKKIQHNLKSSKIFKILQFVVSFYEAGSGFRSRRVHNKRIRLDLDPDTQNWRQVRNVIRCFWKHTRCGFLFRDYDRFVSDIIFSICFCKNPLNSKYLIREVSATTFWANKKNCSKGTYHCTRLHQPDMGIIVP